MDKAIGEKRIHEIFGDKADKVIASLRELSPDFADYIIDFVYGDLFARTGMTDKNRELAIVSCLIGQEHSGLALRTHLLGMLNVGWKKEEILELIIFLIGYIGFPATMETMVVFKEVLKNWEEE